MTHDKLQEDRHTCLWSLPMKRTLACVQDDNSEGCFQVGVGMCSSLNAEQSKRFCTFVFLERLKGVMVHEKMNIPIAGWQK